MRARWAVLISGRGSNLSALLDDRDEVSIALVVSSKPGVDGIFKARRAGIPVHILDKKIDWPALTTLLRERGVTHICLAGFMRIVPPAFVLEWRGRIVNLHPSLLPKYPGLESIGSAHAAGDDIGVTVHEVDEGVDTGTVILQKRSLMASEAHGYSLALAEFYVHVTEQRVLTRVVRAVRSGRAFLNRAFVNGGRV
jgi:phosphoribosylamine--glycine ligase/phosphoribosylglycinamide formyltransferase/phosphoribosylformylglycinamidine cyclo-ligase